MTTTALITGANKGIGFETARQLAARGMTVLLGARDPGRGADAERALRADGLDTRFVQLDVTDEKSIAAAAALIADGFGSLDVLVNNAGIAGGFGGQPSQTSLAELRAILETNVLGAIAVTNAVLPLLLRAPAARVVNVSSEVGSVTFMSDRSSPVWGMPASISYPASKSMLNMVTAMYAKELAGTAVKVNAANPGYCATDLNGQNGFRSAAQGAEVSVHLATLPGDGPTGTLWGYQWGDVGGSYGELPWLPGDTVNAMCGRPRAGRTSRVRVGDGFRRTGRGRPGRSAPGPGCRAP